MISIVDHQATTYLTLVVLCCVWFIIGVLTGKKIQDKMEESGKPKKKRVFLTVVQKVKEEFFFSMHVGRSWSYFALVY